VLSVRASEPATRATAPRSELSEPGPVLPPVSAADANQRSPLARSRTSRLCVALDCWSEKAGSNTPAITGAEPRPV
jgi:hypothetical protein